MASPGRTGVPRAAATVRQRHAHAAVAGTPIAAPSRSVGTSRALSPATTGPRPVRHSTTASTVNGRSTPATVRVRGVMRPPPPARRAGGRRSRPTPGSSARRSGLQSGAPRGPGAPAAIGGARRPGRPRPTAAREGRAIHRPVRCRAPRAPPRPRRRPRGGRGPAPRSPPVPQVSPRLGSTRRSAPSYVAASASPVSGPARWTRGASPADSTSRSTRSTNTGDRASEPAQVHRQSRCARGGRGRRPARPAPSPAPPRPRRAGGCRRGCRRPREPGLLRGGRRGRDRRAGR